MNVPFDLEPSHQPARNPAARWLLFLILGGMIALSLYGYLQRDGTASADYVAIDTQLKMAHRVHQMQLSVGGGTNTKLDFSTPLSEIDKIKKGDPIASRFSIIARHEAKEPLDPKDFLEVEKSPTPRSKATKWIYGTRPIAKADLPLIDKSFPDNLFTDRLARIHAHEKAGDKDYRKSAFPPSESTAMLATFGMFGIATVLGTLLLIAFFVLKLAGSFPSAGHPSGVLSPALADKYALRASILLLGFLAAQFGAAFFLEPLSRLESGTKTGLLMLFILVIMVVIFRLNFDRSSIKYFDLANVKKGLGGHVLWGVGGAIANIPLLLFAIALGQFVFSGLPDPSHPITTELAATKTIWSTLGLFFAAAVAAPLFEEALFRGTILPVLQSSTKRLWVAVALNGFLFAAIHPTGIPAWPALATVGMMGCVLTIQRGSIVPAIVMHAVHNGALVAFQLIL